MKHLPRNIILQSAVAFFVAGLAVLVLIWGWKRVGQEQVAAQTAQARLDALPQAQARATVVTSEISKRQLDIQRVEAFMIAQEALSNVVSEWEAAGSARGLSVSVPAVEEKQLVDDEGNAVPAEGPITEVRLKLVAAGNPKQLLSFLHEIEHAQRLTYLESFRLDAAEETGRNQAAAFQKAEITAHELPAALTADVIIGVRSKGAAEL